MFDPSGMFARLMAQRRIAVVDDDFSFRESLCDLLRSHDHEVLLFSSAESLLRSETPPRADCLLIDASLPGSSGFELQRQLRERGVDTPVIFMTGYDDDSLRALALSEGAIGCLSKPFEEEDLLLALERAFLP